MGDSHSVRVFGPYGEALYQKLSAHNHFDLAYYASCGSNAGHWITGKATTCGYSYQGIDEKLSSGKSAPTPLASELLKTVKPSLTVVALTANYLHAYWPNSKVEIQKFAQMIVNTGSKCLWILAPDRRKDREKLQDLNEMVAKAVSGLCEVEDPTLYTKYPDIVGDSKKDGDGMHYSRATGYESALKWADQVYRRILGLL